MQRRPSSHLLLSDPEASFAAADAPGHRPRSVRAAPTAGTFSFDCGGTAGGPLVNSVPKIVRVVIGWC